MHRVGRAVGGVVERLGTATIPGARRCALAYQHLRRLSLVGRGSNVQRGVARVDVVRDRIEEVRLRVLPGGGDADRTDRERIGRGGEDARDLRPVARRNDSIQGQQRVVGRISGEVRLRYG